MAFQLNAGYTQEIRFSGRDPKQIMVLVNEAIRKMGWRLGHRTKESITAFAGLSICSFGEVILIQLEDDSATISSFCLMPQITAFGKNKRNIRRFVEHLNTVWDDLPEETLAIKYEAISIQLLTAADNCGMQRRPIQLDVRDQYDKFDTFFSIFNPRPGYFVTPIILNLNVLMFLLLSAAGAGVFVPNFDALLHYGANYSLMTLDGQWWRLISCMFMHAGIWHLISNMWALLFFGIYLEPLLGPRRYAIYYLIGGILASLSSLAINSATISVGASGAIFCLYGIFIAMLGLGVIAGPIRKALLTTLIVFIVYNLLSGIKGNSDNAAHIGGLIAGLVIGAVSKRELLGHKPVLTLQTMSGIVGSFLIVAISTYLILPNTLKKYRAGLVQFEQFELMAMHCYHLPQGSTKEDISWEIKNQSIGFWHQSQDLLHQLDRLRLPDKAHIKNKLLLNYCALRIKNCHFELMRLQDDRFEDEYNDSIDANNDRIQEIVYQLQL